MGRVLLLFDLDGTLLLTGGASSRAIQTVCGTLWGERFKWQDVLAGQLDPDIFRDLAARSGIANPDSLLPEYRNRYLLALQDELTRNTASVRALPGVKELLASLSRRRELVLGLLTGNYAEATDLKLRAAGLDPSLFQVGVFAEDAPTRPGLVPVARQRCQQLCGWSPGPEQILIIGDTPRDVDAARRNGCRVAAIATGRYGVPELAALNPDLVLTDLSDPRPLDALLDQILCDPKVG